MPSPPGTGPQRRRLLRDGVDRFAADLTTADAARPVPGLEWNVAGRDGDEAADWTQTIDRGSMTMVRGRHRKPDVR